MKKISFRDIGLKYVLSPYEKPVAHVKPGETFVVKVEDAIRIAFLVIDYVDEETIWYRQI